MEVGEEGEALTRMTTHTDPIEFSLNGTEPKYGTHLVSKMALMRKTDILMKLKSTAVIVSYIYSTYTVSTCMSQRQLDSTDITAMGKLANTFGKD